MQIIKDSIKTIAVSLIALSLISVACAWTEPASNPPAGNANPPITTASTTQTKTGWFTADNIETYGNTYLSTITGKVGIGTTEPGMKLEVGSVANGIATSGSTATGGFRLRGASPAYNNVLDMGIVMGGSWLQSTDVTDLSQKYNLLLNPNGGNVGIGTVMPVAPLHVSQKQSNGDAYNAISIGSSPDAGRNGSSELNFVGNGTSGDGAYIDYSKNNNRKLTFRSINTDAAGNESEHSSVMALDHVGNVGIGTPAPDAKLHTYGEYSGGSGDYTNITGAQLKIQAASTGSGYWRIPSISSDTAISGVYNYQTGKDVYWGEPSDTGKYRFRGRNLIVENGNVGIGQTATDPGFKIDVQGTGPSDWITQFKNTTYGTGIHLGGRSNLGIIGTIGAGSMSLNPDGGNVGIGTPTPGAKLEVYNASAVEESAIRVNNQASAGYASRVELWNANGVKWALRAGGSGRGDYGNSAFMVEEETAGSAGTRFMIKKGGNVGIGTQDPSEKVEVFGGNIATKTKYDFFFGNSAGTNMFIFKNEGNGGTTSTAIDSYYYYNPSWFFNPANRGMGLRFYTSYALQSPFSGAWNPATLTEQMRITPYGSVGIGVTDPKARLDVDGMIKLKMYTTLPSCDSSVRGMFAFKSDGSGLFDNTDRLYVCGYYLVSGSGGYQWRNVGP